LPQARLPPTNTDSLALSRAGAVNAIKKTPGKTAQKTVALVYIIYTMIVVTDGWGGIVFKVKK
jgi:hypothetical protein